MQPHEGTAVEVILLIIFYTIIYIYILYIYSKVDITQYIHFTV